MPTASKTKPIAKAKKAPKAEPKKKPALSSGNKIWAVIKAGGKQYLVQPQQELQIELVGEEKQLEFEPLLVINQSQIQVGTPVVSGIKVKAEVMGEAKGEKIKVLKYKPKKRIKKLTGHRQHYSLVKITSIK